MAITVDEMTTEVITEPEASTAASNRDEPWREPIRVREAMARINRDRSRTAAEGFDD